MGTESLGQVGSPTNKPTSASIKKVNNGFIVSGYQFEEMIANTFEEAVKIVDEKLNAPIE